EEAATTLFQHYKGLCDQAVAQHPQPDLMVWPETSWPGVWIEAPPGQPDKNRRDMTRWLADRWGVNNLVGLNACIQETDDRQRLYNSALLISGTGQVGARYDKMH